MKYYLGLDAGGTKTYTLIADEQGVVVGKGRSGNGNHQVDYEEAKRNITESVEMALQEANLTRKDISFAYFGLAGADREADYRILRPLIGSLGFERYDLNCDTIIALRAGTTRPYGVVLICGTGTNSAGRSPEGITYQCGGFSYQYGDYGGGGELAVEAFRSVVRAWDGRERPTRLTELVLQELGYKSVQEMVDDYMDHDRIPPRHLVKLVFQAASEGDEVAGEILRFQGVELGKSARAVIKRLGMEQESFDVVMAGSVLARGQGDIIIDQIRQYVKETAPGASVVRLQVEPVVGALWLAMEAEGGGKLSPEAYDRLKGVSNLEDWFA
ncbi:N-acetylglucosamine kinase [Paenibacillus tuaregi]|uniref:N-acetylglucosamine kinase n=1 Tax=Paenibacillus tuaregi TaxID=1816681 RepID=UPI0008388839|nr:BadF/BadG/BcrA/BcrD ATPase family protein [Paenibacillus tuaregi]